MSKWLMLHPIKVGYSNNLWLDRVYAMDMHSLDVYDQHAPDCLLQGVFC